jgi:DNA-binding NarL/FixJ family response regulator
MTLRAIVAGDAEPFLDSLVTLVLDLEEKLEVIGWARDQEEAVALARSACPDLALVSSMTAPVDGVEATREILAANPSCRVIVLGSSGSAQEVERAWEAGAAGYVTLDAFSIDLLALALSAQETSLQTRASFPALALP